MGLGSSVLLKGKTYENWVSVYKNQFSPEEFERQNYYRRKYAKISLWPQGKDKLLNHEEKALINMDVLKI